MRLIEPSGFTKVSALGVEEQRVNVIIDPAKPLEAWDDLQEGYGVDARIVISRHADVVIVPTGALFREGEDWAVLVIEEGFAKTRRVKIGRQNGVRAELKEGLEVGERVILYPSELVEEGSAVEVR